MKLDYAAVSTLKDENSMTLQPSLALDLNGNAGLQASFPLFLSQCILVPTVNGSVLLREDVNTFSNLIHTPMYLHYSPQAAQQQREQQAVGNYAPVVVTAEPVR